LITGASDHPEAASYFIGNGAQHFGISTAISLGVTKIQRVLKKTPFWTNTMLFSHSLGRTEKYSNHHQSNDDYLLNVCFSNAF